MKILHAILTEDFAGSENHCAQLAALQAAAGEAVRVVIKGRNPLQVARFREILPPNVLVVLPGRWPSLLDGWLLRRTVAGFAPEVIHTHLGRATRRMAKVARAFGIPQVASLHLNYQPKVYAGCAGLICVAGWQRPTLASYQGVVGVVRNWVPKRQGEVKSMRPTLHVPSATFVIGSVGRLDNQKGYDVLVRAFRQAFPHGDEPVALVVAGEGPMRAELDALAGGDGRVRLVGYQAHIPSWLAAYDGFVSSSRFEGLALVVLEALGAGLPLLLTDVAGNAELAGLQEDGTIDLVPPEDVDALAQGLQRLVAAGPRRMNYDLRELEAATAAARVATVYGEVLERHAANNAKKAA